MARATPVIVGIAHVEQRADNLDTAKEPVDLMIQAVKAAAQDAGSPALLQAPSVRVVRGMWPYQNPARAVAEAIGNPTAETTLTPFGGNFVQSTVNVSALEIQSGALDAVIIAGAECGQTQSRAAKQGVELNWQELAGSPDRMLGEEGMMRHDAEVAVRLGRPIHVYPIFETALRKAMGHGVEEHQKRVSELWARFAAVAADNPNAWIRKAPTAAEIRTPSATNRPVSFPYPKLMNSNNNVDQGAALILCSTDKARALGIPEEKWVYPWAGTDAHDHYMVSNRDTLHTSPAIRLAGNRCMELAGLTTSDIDLVDIYSCFPSAVQVAARELGFDIEQQLTVTGGLTFAGGPLNNYVMHSIARMVDLLRNAPGKRGLITANGGYLTKHAFGVYSTEAPAQPFRHEDLQAEVDATPWRDAVVGWQGPATVEGYSVVYTGDKATRAYVACRLADERRAWGVCEEASVLEAMTTEEFCGRPVNLSDHVASF